MSSKKPTKPGITLPQLGRVYRLTYSNGKPDDDPQLFKDRDSLAFLELAAQLFRMGYRYGTTIYLYPDDERRLTDFPRFEPNDVLVLTTRPPLHDKVGFVPQRRKVIHGAKTELEAILFKEFSNYFAWCTRKHVELTAHGLNCLQVADRQRWQHVELYEYFVLNKTLSAAEVQKHYVGPEVVLPSPNHHSSIAFFLRANRLPGINCDFVASFGMDAFGTLLWNRMIRHQFATWLAEPRFVMAELVFKQQLPVRPITPEFNDADEYVEARLLTDRRGA